MGGVSTLGRPCHIDSGQELGQWGVAHTLLCMEPESFEMCVRKSGTHFILDHFWHEDFGTFDLSGRRMAQLPGQHTSLNCPGGSAGNVGMPGFVRSAGDLACVDSWCRLNMCCCG